MVRHLVLKDQSAQELKRAQFTVDDEHVKARHLGGGAAGRALGGEAAVLDAHGERHVEGLVEEVYAAQKGEALQRVLDALGEPPGSHFGGAGVTPRLH